MDICFGGLLNQFSIFLTCTDTVLVKQKNMFLLAFVKTLKNCNDCSVSRFKFLFRHSSTHWLNCYSVLSWPAFSKTFRVTGGFRKDWYWKDFHQCCGSGSRIRCLFDPWIQDTGSGIGFFRIPDPKPIFLELSDNFLCEMFIIL
jgi:hypothetical protein